MSIRFKSIIFSLALHLLIAVVAFFITFDMEKPPEFIEIEFAQAMPMLDQTQPENDVESAEPPTPPETEPEEISKPEPKTEPKTVTTPKETPPKQTPKSVPKEETPQNVKPEKVTPPKRDFLAEDEEDKAFVGNKDLPSPTEDFDDFLDVNEADIKGADIPRYETETPPEETEELPDVPKPGNLSDDESDQTPNGGTVEGDGSTVADINLDIEGSIKDRKVTSRPDIDPSEVEQAGTIKIKIEVSPEGLVVTQIPLQRGGYLEKLAMDNLRKWRFEKLPSEQPQEKQSGVVTFTFVLR